MPLIILIRKNVLGLMGKLKIRFVRFSMNFEYGFGFCAIFHNLCRFHHNTIVTPAKFNVLGTMPFKKTIVM
jgi:hypothetical protein